MFTIDRLEDAVGDELDAVGFASLSLGLAVSAVATIVTSTTPTGSRESLLGVIACTMLALAAFFDARRQRAGAKRRMLFAVLRKKP